MPAQRSTPMIMTDCASPHSPAAHHAVSSAVAIKCAGRLYQVLQQTGYQQLHGLLSCQASSPDSTPLLRSSRRLGAAPLSQQPTASTHGVSHSRCTSGAATPQVLPKQSLWRESLTLLVQLKLWNRTTNTNES